MKVKPPVKLEEIEVCHRLGRPPNQAASHQPRDGVDARDDQSLDSERTVPIVGALDRSSVKSRAEGSRRG